MKTSLIIIGIVILVLAGWLLISKTGQYQNIYPNNTIQTESLVKFDKAPNFNLQDYNGKTVTFADFVGKPIVINSWAAWCSFCKRELSDFAAVQKEFGDKVVIIAIDRAETRETAKRYSDELGVTDNLVFLLDPRDSFYQSIGGFSMPETIFVDKNGNIIEHKRGIMDMQEMREKVQKIISNTL